MTVWLRRVALAVCVLVVAVLAALLVLRVVSNVKHANKVTDQRDTLIAALQATNAIVITDLTKFDAELVAIRHPSRQILRLRRQIEHLQVRVAPPAPQPTATVTRTVRPPAQPRATVTVPPPCRGIHVNGGCVPTHVPTLMPSLGLVSS